MASSNTLDMTQGSVTKKLISFTIPILLSALLQHLYTIADRIVVGNFAENGKVALAAVGSTGSATNLLLNLFNGMSVGVNVVCANLRGSRKQADLQRCMHNAMLLSVIFGVMLMGIGVVLCKQILLLMKTPADVLPLAATYMRIYFLGMPASLVYNFGAAILRSHGDSKRSMYILSVTGIVNVVLNLVLVIGFHMDVAGVAIATIVAQYLSAAAILWILFSPRQEYGMRIKQLCIHKAIMKKIIAIGVPCGINGILINVANVIVQTAVNDFGSADIIAGNTAATDINNFSYLVNGAFSSACVSFSGQCYGAKQYRRMDKLVLTSVGYNCIIDLLLAAVVSLFPRQLLGIFNSDPNVVEAGVFKLLLCAWSTSLFAVSETMVGCVRGMGRSMPPMIINIICLCGVRLVWVLAVFPLCPHKTAYLYLCYPVSWVIAAVSQTAYFLHCRKKLNS